MRLEAVDFLKIVLSKFCKFIYPQFIKHNIFIDLVSLYT
jgi:hypothetical protein